MNNPYKNNPSFRDVTEQFINGGFAILVDEQPKCKEQPSDWKFRLDFERKERIDNPTEPQIMSGIRSLRVVEGDSYCILSRRDGDYVQTVCGVNGLHVEWRQPDAADPNGFSLFKAGYPDSTQREERCQKPVLHVPGKENELLNRGDAITIFLAFVAGEEKPAQFVWRRMSYAEMY